MFHLLFANAHMTRYHTVTPSQTFHSQASRRNPCHQATRMKITTTAVATMLSATAKRRHFRASVARAATSW